MQTSETFENQLEIYGIDLKESRVECCDENGTLYFDYSYDIDKEWEEVDEGGIVVNAGFVYYPTNIVVFPFAINEEGHHVSYYLSHADRSNIITYIYTHLYNNRNEIQ